jgi:hypothetical protein
MRRMSGRRKSEMKYRDESLLKNFIIAAAVEQFPYIAENYSLKDPL